MSTKELHHTDNIGCVMLRTIDLHLMPYGQLILANYKSLELHLLSSSSSSSAYSFTTSSASMSSASPCLIFGSGTRSLWVDLSFDSCMGTSVSQHNQGGVYEGSDTLPLSGLYYSPLNNIADIEFDVLHDRI